MARQFRSLALTSHTVMAALFALATISATRYVLEAWQGAEGGWPLTLSLLAALGFVSLTAREVRILAVARRERHQSDSDARAE